MIVEDIATENSVVFGIDHDCKDAILEVHVFTGSAETLVRRSEITVIQFSLLFLLKPV